MANILENVTIARLLHPSPGHQHTASLSTCRAFFIIFLSPSDGMQLNGERDNFEERIDGQSGEGPVDR